MFEKEYMLPILTNLLKIQINPEKGCYESY